MLRAPLNGPYVACRRRGTPPGHQGEGVGETDGLVRFQQDVSDPDFRQAPVQVENQLIGGRGWVGRNALQSSGAWGTASAGVLSAA